MDKPLYNSLVIKNYLDYLRDHYPDVNIRELLNYAGIAEYEVEDRGHWLTQTQVNRFNKYISRAIDHEDIPRMAGRYAASPHSSTSAILTKSIAGFLSPAMAYWAVEKIVTTVSRHIFIKSNHLTRNSIELIVTSKPGVKEEPFQCRNRLGMFEGIAKIFTGKYAAIEHPECQHEGGACCRYIISWESPKSFTWKRVGYYALAASALSSFPLFYILTPNHWLTATLTLALLLISTGILLTGLFLHNRELASNLIQQSKTSEDIFTQLNLRYNESLLVKEIGEAASSILDPHALLTFVTEDLSKRLMFERSMVLLTNPAKTKLVYSASHGFTPHEEALLRNISFNLVNPEPPTYFHEAYFQQKPILVDDAKLAAPHLPEKGYQTVHDLGITSFICVPIVYKKNTEGLLAVDTSKLSDKPTHSNISLLVGVARQIGVCLNIAMAHKQILENEQRFRNLSENSPDIIYQLDPEGRITYVNPVWEEILGHHKTDLEGNCLSDFLKQTDRASYREMIHDILQNSQRVRDRYFTIFNVRGLPRHITLSGAPDMDAEGSVMGIVGTMKDITSLWHMEAQLFQASKMEALGTLTGGIAHDFNNIIQAIMGYNQLIISGRLGNEEDLPYLKNIGELMTRSRELVRQLLLFSKKVEPLARVVNINEEIRSLNNLLSKSIPKMIEVQTDLFEDIFPIVADPAQIGQIIMNLVINARDAVAESGLIIIKTRNLILSEKSLIRGAYIKPGAYIQLSVADTGCGMDKETMNRIFEPFFTTKEPGKGTGLGLAVIQGIVKNHDGYIYCESKPNGGTTFYVIFPASSGGMIEILQDAERQDVSGTEKILLVDDEESILETGRDTLIQQGYRVVTASSGEEAIEIYRGQHDALDLVILDLIMPGGGGKKCLHDLLDINPDVKVLISSGYTSGRRHDDLALAGAAGFIQKPYQPEDLFSSIRKILDAPSRDFNAGPPE